MPVARQQVDPMIERVNAAIGRFRDADGFVVTIGNEFSRLDPANAFRRGAAVKGTAGTAWDRRIESSPAPYFPKWRSDAFCNPELQRYFDTHGITTLTLAGVYAGGCITATAKSARRCGFAVNILSDAIADGSDRKRNEAINQLQRLGVTVCGLS